MYATYVSKPEVKVKMANKEILKKGFEVIRNNGEVDFLRAKDLNIPNGNFRRLYTQRAAGRGPPKFNQQRYNLHPMNKWWYEKFVGEDPRNINWEQRLIHSLNATYNLSPDDPEFINTVKVKLDYGIFQKEDLLNGDLSKRVDKRVEKTINWSSTF